VSTTKLIAGLSTLTGASARWTGPACAVSAGVAGTAAGGGFWSESTFSLSSPSCFLVSDSSCLVWSSSS